MGEVVDVVMDIISLGNHFKLFFDIFLKVLCGAEEREEIFTEKRIEVASILWKLINALFPFFILICINI